MAQRKLRNERGIFSPSLHTLRSLSTTLHGGKLNTGERSIFWKAYSKCVPKASDSKANFDLFKR